MPFMRIFPLAERDSSMPDHLGHGHPARCSAQRPFGADEYYLNINEVASFEECPLYLVSQSEPNALVNGIRLRLHSGEIVVVPDDPEDTQNGFLSVLQRAARGEVVEMEYSRHLRELEKANRL